MTREEARDQIVIFMCDEQKVINDRDKQALEMAIQALSSWETYSDKLWKEAYERGKAEALSQEPCDDTEIKKIDEWEIKGKNVEVWLVKGKLQVRYLGTIHNIPLPPVKSQEPCDKCVYSTKDGYCQYDDISETIPPLEPCTDAVSRDAILEWCGDINMDVYTDEVKEFVNGLPSVTQKSGKWLYKEITDDYRVTGQCSECKERRLFDNFCPNCGAKMESEVRTE